MADYTSEVAELSAAYQANRSANAVINTEVRGKYRAIIAAEIEERKATNDKKFADHLARVKERSGIPVGVIQDHILHTKSWDRWTYWRDLGEIPAEQVSRSLAREERKVAEERGKITFEWRDKVLYVLKNPATGETLPHEIAVPLYNQKSWYQGVDPTPVEKAVNDLAGGRSEGLKLYLAVAAEIKRAFAEEEITESTNPFDYVNDLPSDQQGGYLLREDRKNYTYNPWIENA